MDNQNNQGISFPTPSDQLVNRDPSESKKSPFGIILIIVAILLLISGAVWYFFFNGSQEESTIEVVNESIEPTIIVPTDTPEPTQVSINRDEIKIQVLNGSGITGEASYAQGVLANLGYSEIKTGNSDKKNQEMTTITYKSSVSEASITEISDKLKTIYEEVTLKEATSSQVYDIIITVGLRKGQKLPTAVPTAKPTTAVPTGSVTPTTTPSATPTP